MWILGWQIVITISKSFTSLMTPKESAATLQSEHRRNGASLKREDKKHPEGKDKNYQYHGPCSIHIPCKGVYEKIFSFS